MTNMPVPSCHEKAHLLLGARNWSDEMCGDVLARETFRQTVVVSGRGGWALRTAVRENAFNDMTFGRDVQPSGSVY